MAKHRNRPAASQAFLNLVYGYWSSQLLFVAARLNLGDVLASRPLSAASIARRVGADAAAMNRVLRALCSIGLLSASPSNTYSLTRTGELLRTDVPGSLKNYALMIIDDWKQAAWAELEYGVRTGKSAFKKAHGAASFDFLKAHPQKERTFARAMAEISAVDNAAIAAAYDFERFHHIVDVGGAHGHLLAAILKRSPKSQGVLFDQPQVVAGATRAGYLSQPALRKRCAIIGGSFFDAVPPDGDLYVLKYIIHDWGDEESLTILRNCRDAMLPNGRLLIVDHVIREVRAGDWGALMDINMMVGPGGQERTVDEFRRLLSRARLYLKQVIPTDGPLSIIEATRL